MQQENNSSIYVDELSGVKNRRYLSVLKRDVIPRMREKSGVFSVVITDLDHFKEINDTYGHLKGDEAIRNFGQFLKENLRKDDIVIRYGGDEFVVVQLGLSEREVFIVWDRLINRLKQMDYSGIKLSASAGIASYPEDGITFDELFRKADSRLYNAKKNGRGRVGVEDVAKRIRIPSSKLIDRVQRKEELLQNIQKGNITIIRGEAGIGKTRLMKEVLSTLRNVDILWSDCLALDRKIAYYVVRELVKYRIKRSGEYILKEMPDSLKIEISKVVPGLFKEGEVGYMDEVIDRYRLYEAIRFVIAYGEREKIIVIDNMQWVDEDSIEVINYIVRVDKEKKIRFVFAVREEEESDLSERFFTNLSRDRKVEVVRLFGMKPVHMKELVREIVNDRVPLLEEYVAGKSAGNPFYAEELIQSLHDNGYLDIKNNRWFFAPPEKDILPRGVEDMVKRRLSQISPEARELIKVLSVAVKGYIDLLVEITGFNESHVFGLIEEGLKAGLLRENDEGEYVEFKSELIRSVIYHNELSKLKKKMLHRKVAEWIESNLPDGTEEDLAYHYYVQENAEKVVKYGTQAGDKLRKMYANRDALRYYTWALERIEELDRKKYEEEHIKLLHKIAEVYRVLGDYSKAEEYYRKAAELAEKSGLYNLIASSYNGLAWTHQVLGKVEEARKIAEKALSIANEYNLTSEKIAAYNTLGIIYRDTERGDDTFKMYQKALDLAEGDENIKSRATILNNMAIYLHEHGEFDRALKYYDLAESLSSKGHLLKEQAMVVYNRALIHIDRREEQLAKRYLNRAINIARKIGYRRIEASALWAFGYFMHEQGKFEDAKRYLDGALYNFYNIQDIRMIGVAYSTLGAVEKALGFYKRSLSAHEKSLKAFEKINNVVNAAVEDIAIGSIHLVRGNFKDAEMYFVEALEKTRVVKSDVYTIRAFLSLAELSIARKEYEKAREFVERAKAIVKTADSELWRIRIMEYDLAYSEGRYDYLYDMAKGIKELLPEEAVMDDRVIVEIYVADACIMSGRKEDAYESIERLNKVLLSYPHSEFLIDEKYLRWKYAQRFGEKDAEELFREAKEGYEALNLKTKVTRMVDDKRIIF